MDEVMMRLDVKCVEFEGCVMFERARSRAECVG